MKYTTWPGPLLTPLSLSALKYRGQSVARIALRVVRRDARTGNRRCNARPPAVREAAARRAARPARMAALRVRAVVKAALVEKTRERGMKDGRSVALCPFYEGRISL